MGIIARRGDRRMAYDEIGGPATLVQHRHTNPNKVFGRHEDPAFQDYHARVGKQLKDPAFTKAAIAVEDAPPSKQKKQRRQHKAVVKKKRAAKKKPSKKALAIHIAHAIARAEKKKKADTINIIAR